MQLDWELCDRTQNVLTRLDNRRAGARVEIGLNGADRRGFCPLSLEDPAYDKAAAVETILRATLKGGPADKTLLNGRVIIPEQGISESGEALGLNAVGPMFQLDRALARKVSGSTWEAVTFAGKDQAQIMWSLVEAAKTHGVIKGTLQGGGINRDRTYVPGKEVGPALVEMSEVINGPDFEFEPVRASDGTLTRFNTFYPRKGEDKSEDVVFVIGAPPYTASGFTFAPGGDEIVNRVVAIGAPLNNEGEEQPYATFPAYEADHAASIAKYGVFEQLVQLEDVVEVSTLKAHAEAFVAANAYPIPYFDFTSAFEPLYDEVGAGVPPIYGIDYEVGDTVGIEAFLGGTRLNGQEEPVDEDGVPILPLRLEGRITDVVITETESGLLQVKSTCSPEVKAEGVSGKSVTLKVPEAGE